MRTITASYCGSMNRKGDIHAMGGKKPEGVVHEEEESRSVLKESVVVMCGYIQGGSKCFVA